MPNFVNLQFSAGEDYRQPFLIYDSTGANLQDITGWTLQLKVQQYADPTFTVYPALLTYPGVVDSGPAGSCHVQFNSVDTSALAPRSYWVELRRIDSGAQAALVEGYLNLLP